MAIGVGTEPVVRPGQKRRRPCHIEGCHTQILFLTDDEIRARWQRYRPPIERGVPTPSWLAVGEEIDYAHDCVVPRKRPTTLRIQGVRYGWLFATGISPVSIDASGKEVWVTDDRGQFNWHDQYYDSYFWPVSEALRILVPGWGKRISLWDRILVDELQC